MWYSVGAQDGMRGKAECFLCGSILIHRWETWNPFALSCVETA